MAVGERDGPGFGFGHAGKINKWRYQLDSEGSGKGLSPYIQYGVGIMEVLSKVMALSEVTSGGGAWW